VIAPDIGDSHSAVSYIYVCDAKRIIAEIPEGRAEVSPREGLMLDIYLRPHTETALQGKNEDLSQTFIFKFLSLICSFSINLPHKLLRGASRRFTIASSLWHHLYLSYPWTPNLLN